MKYRVSRNTWAYNLPTWIKYWNDVRPSENDIMNRFCYKYCRAMDGSRLNEV